MRLGAPSGGLLYAAARREKQDAQAAAVAAQAQMETEVSAARAELSAAQKQAKTDIEKASSSADSKMREYVDKFRDQVRWWGVKLHMFEALSACILPHILIAWTMHCNTLPLNPEIPKEVS